jgi:hypothetical protein
MSTEFQSAAISEELRAAVISEEFRQKESKHNIQQKGAQDQRHRVHAELGLLSLKGAPCRELSRKR